MQIEKFKAFILSSIPFGETDCIATLLTLEQGTISVFAKSARSSKKRFGAKIEPVQQIEAEIELKESSLSRLLNSDPTALYPNIRADFCKITLALYASELVAALSPAGHPVPRLYRLFSAYMYHLDTSPALHDDRCFFEINLLNILGYRPSLENCPSCGESYNSYGAAITASGETICRSCLPRHRSIVSENGLKLLCSSLATGKFGSVLFGDSLTETSAFLRLSICSHLGGRALNSLKFIDI